MAALLFSAPAVAQDAAAPDELTLERIFDSPALSGPSLRQAKLSPAGDRVTFLRGREDDRSTLDVWEYNLELDQTRRLISADEVLAEPVELSDEEKARRERARIADLSGIVEYRWAKNGRHLLFPLGGDIFLADLAGEPITVRQLTAGEAFDLDPKISPDGSTVAFVRDQDLWVVDVEDGDVRALTDDGEGTLKNGMAEFIAQEEMGRSTGYWWSPDGNSIAFLQVDESPIAPSERYEVSGDRIEIIEQHYPYAGTDNVRYRLGVVDVESGSIRWIPLGEASFEEQDIYIPRVAWLPDNSGLTFQRQSRDQQTLELMLHEFETDEQRLLVREQSTTWINLHDDLHFLDGMEAFIWSSERSGYRRLYLIGLDGEILRPLTGGDWPVAGLAGVDEDLGLVYFSAGMDTPAEKHLYRQSLVTETPEAVHRVSRRNGWHDFSFDSAARTYLDTFSSTDQPPQLSLHSADGERLAWLIENRVDDDHPYAPFMPGHRPTEFGTLNAADGQALHYRMIKPTGFDQTRQYPVFVHVYGGPTSRMVVNSWGRRHLVDQYMARSGYIVFSVDNRGIAGQGVAFQAPAHLNLGQVEVEDQMVGIKYLKSLPYVDPGRIGVFGWSYGGYITLMLLMQQPEIFAAGVAVAPVTDWALYDTHYTERYLGMPTDDEGEPTEAYRRANVLEYAETLADPLLLVHGMADDNVLFTHSTMLMQKLQAQAIDFELMTYPGEKHAISGEDQRLHVYRQIDRFLERNLME
ncbi:MAG: S9 family peptidase [Wenzhouxiangellaceae bacterium]